MVIDTAKLDIALAKRCRAMSTLREGVSRKLCERFVRVVMYGLM